VYGSAGGTSQSGGSEVRRRLAVFGVVALLVPLALYLYTYDYGIGRRRALPQGRPASRDLRVSVEVPAQPVERGASCPVTVSIANATGRRISIADFDGRQGMFTIDVTFQAGSIPPVSQKDGRKAPWSRALDPVIDLLPGAAYSRTLDLAELFRMSIPGSYVVSVGYDPEAYFAVAGATAKRTKGLWLGKAGAATATVTLIEKGTAPAPEPAAAGGG